MVKLVTKTACKVLNEPNNRAILDDEMIAVSRQDLETEHRQLLSRLHQVRRLLGYPALLTGKQRRQQNQL